MRRTASIVIRGAFNPLIFHPLWFAESQLIGSDEAKKATEHNGIKILHPDVTIWELDWLNIQVSKERFAATVKAEPYERVHDLVVGAFTVLIHTPLRLVGINLETVFSAESAKHYHAIGDTLAPKSCWAALLGEFNAEKRAGGLRELVMEHSPRADGLKGYIRTKVAPTPEDNFDVLVEVNDHIEVAKEPVTPGADPLNARDVLDIIQAHWLTSQKRSQAITDSIQAIGK
ncbi:MAG: hypothetical protein SFV19_08730 [Rhodospirillaceae bacterium]|nr:hypothetical protein [Rhodospirillaceae bacterium]